MEKRTNKILEILTENEQAQVTELSSRLGVSQVTIRKDLNELEQRGIITREHGFARLSSADDLHGRIAYHYDAKKSIAAAAARLVSDGDMIMIENGSCCALLADELTSSKKNLTIITNSAFITDYIRGKSDFQVILLGGIYQQDSQVLVGPMIGQCVRNFYVKLFFIGADGYTPGVGFTNRDQMRAQAVRDMASHAEHVVILTESEKFSHGGSVLLNIDGKRTVITDKNIPDDARKELVDGGAEVVLV